MSLAHDPRPPLPDWITDAYAVLSTRIADSTDDDGAPSIARDRAVAILHADETLALERADAEHALERLLERGYLYEVDTELRVTTPPE